MKTRMKPRQATTQATGGRPRPRQQGQFQNRSRPGVNAGGGFDRSRFQNARPQPRIGMGARQMGQTPPGYQQQQFNRDSQLQQTMNGFNMNSTGQAPVRPGAPSYGYQPHQPGPRPMPVPEQHQGGMQEQHQGGMQGGRQAGDRGRRSGFGGQQPPQMTTGYMPPGQLAEYQKQIEQYRSQNPQWQQEFNQQPPWQRQQFGQSQYGGYRPQPRFNPYQQQGSPWGQQQFNPYSRRW